MQINNGELEYNELSKDSNGGTEITSRGLFSKLEKSELDGLQIISSRVRNLEENNIRILWLHDLANDPESQLLRDENNRNKFHKLVFSSNWQYQHFRDYLGVPYSFHSTVIETGVEPIEFIEKPKDKIRLIYTSTPHRGLSILVPVFIELAKNNPDIELNVFSSFKLYGPSWAGRDEPFEALFQQCRDHPQINYHGASPREDVIEAYKQAHIFAYPSIWPETSCRSLIEGMSAGCLCVHPNFAALTDTSGGLTVQYDGDHTNHNLHAGIFADALQHTINQVRTTDVTPMTRFIKSYADTRFSWDNVILKWKSLIAHLKATVNDTSFPQDILTIKSGQ